ncbi:D-alanyl-D-alanine carboxypeptidase family protein [Guggenheimella bovis]
MKKWMATGLVILLLLTGCTDLLERDSIFSEKTNEPKKVKEKETTEPEVQTEEPAIAPIVHEIPLAPFEKNKAFGTEGLHFITTKTGLRSFDPSSIAPVPLKDVTTTSVVNKFNSLSDEYAPTDLVEIKTNSTRTLELRKEAAEAWTRLEKDASDQGLTIVVVSAYRTKEYQQTLYENYQKKNKVNAVLYSAYPRRSEHEMGLALDLGYKDSLPDHFFDHPEGIFLRDNAHKYGFILRYPEGKEEITGYAYESWHYRYVGEKLAKELKEKNITLEEYYKLEAEKILEKDLTALGTIEIVTDDLNVRTSPDTQSTILGKLKKGDSMRYYEHQGDWIKIFFKEEPAWIHSKYVNFRK